MEKHFIDNISTDKFKCYVHFDTNKIHIVLNSEFDNHIITFGYNTYPECNSIKELFNYKLANVRALIRDVNKFKEDIIKHISAVELFINLDDASLSLLPNDLVISSSNIKTILPSYYRDRSIILSSSYINNTDIGDINNLRSLYDMCNRINNYNKSLLTLFTNYGCQ